MSKLSFALKSYVGRLFALRKRSNITGSFTSKDGNSSLIPREEFPNLVLVLDETNTKVRILKKDGFAIWIPKHFLLKEVLSKPEPEISNVLQVLIMLTGSISTLSQTEQEKVAGAVSIVRNLLDKKKVAKAK